jgi:hypothetical protein
MKALVQLDLISRILCLRDCELLQLWSSRRQADDCGFSYRKTVWWIFQIGYLDQRKWGVQLFWIDGGGG